MSLRTFSFLALLFGVVTVALQWPSTNTPPAAPQVSTSREQGVETLAMKDTMLRTNLAGTTAPASNVEPLSQEDQGESASGWWPASGEESSLVVRGNVKGILPRHRARARVLWIPQGAVATGNSQSGEVLTTSLEKDGSFLFSELRPSGYGEVRIYLGLHDPPLANIPVVRPHTMDAVPDSRLDPLQLKPYTHILLRFEDQDGNPVEGVRYRLSPQSLSFPRMDSVAFGSEVELFTQEEIPEVLAFHPFFRIYRGRLSPGLNTLTLRDSYRATIEFTELPVVPEGMQLRMRIITQAGDGIMNPHVIDLPSTLPPILPGIGIPVGGTYEIMLELKKGRHFEVVEYPDGRLLHTLHVPDLSGQVFRFAFPNEGIAKAAKVLEMMK